MTLDVDDLYLLKFPLVALDVLAVRPAAIIALTKSVLFNVFIHRWASLSLGYVLEF